MSDDTMLQPIEGALHQNFAGMHIDVMTAGENAHQAPGVRRSTTEATP